MSDPLSRGVGLHRHPGSPESSMASSSASASASASTTLHHLGAPTPFNTHIETNAFDTASIDEGSVEAMWDDHDGDVSLSPSMHAPTSTSSHLPHHSPSALSSRAGSYLLPSSPTQSTGSVPHSTRPVPAPPLTLRSTNAVHTDSTGTTLSIPTTPHSNKLAFIDDHDHDHDPGSSAFSTSTTRHRRPSTLAGTQEEIDAKRLLQLGYDPVLGRDYTFWSSLSISTINIGCLQGVVFGVYGIYSYGGPVTLLIAWPLSGVFTLILTAILGEMSSAYPVAGGMASWAWKLARGGIGGERYWGWLMGGVVLGGHLANVLLITWEMCTIISGTMEMAFDYNDQRYHSVLFFLAILTLCGIMGATGWGRSHRFWLACGAYFIAVYLILNVSLLVNIIRHHEHVRITTHFYNSTGWSSRSYVSVLGWQYCTLASGMDASAHMAEETQRPARSVPLAMMGSVIATYVLGYISIILLILAVRPHAILDPSEHHFPFGQILTAAINKQGAVAICSLLVILLTCQVLAQLQASSRFVFSLARDNAMPFAESIRRTNSSKQPVVAHLVTVALCVPFCLLTLAGKGTLYSVLAVACASLSYWGYLIPMFLYVLSNVDLQNEGRSWWTLRKWSKPVAVVSIAYCVAIIVAQMLPGKRPVNATTVSWSPVILVGTLITCVITWQLYGNRHYSGPIRALTKWETGVEIDLQMTLASQRSRKTDTLSGDTGLTPQLGSDDPAAPKMFDSDINALGVRTAEVPTVTIEPARSLSVEEGDTHWTQDSWQSEVRPAGNISPYPDHPNQWTRP